MKGLLSKIAKGGKAAAAAAVPKSVKSPVAAAASPPAPQSAPVSPSSPPSLPTATRVLNLQLDDVSLARVISHKLFADAQSIILLLRLAGDEVACITKPSFVIHVVNSALRVVASRPLASLRALSLKSSLVVSLHPASSLETDVHLSLVDPTEVCVALLCIPRLCRAFSTSDPLAPPAPSQIDVSQRCPVLADLDAIHLVARRRAPAPALDNDDGDDDDVPRPLAPAPSQSADALAATAQAAQPLAVLKQWESNPQADPIAQLAAKLEGVAGLLTSLDDWTAQPPPSLQALHTRHVALAHSQARLQSLHALITAVLANPLPGAPAPPPSLLLALQTQVEGAGEFVPTSSPHGDFLAHANELAALKQSFAALPAKLLATAQALQQLEPLCANFGAMVAQHVSARLDFYYSYDLVDQGRAVLPRYVALFAAAARAHSGVRDMVQTAWTSLSASLLFNKATSSSLASLATCTEHESELVESRFGLSLDPAIAACSAALLAAQTSLPATARMLAECDRTPPPSRFDAVLVEPLRLRLREQLGDLVVRAKSAPESFALKDLGELATALRDSGVHRAACVRALCRALTGASASLRVLHACAAVDVEWSAPLSARLEAAARETLEAHEPFATLLRGTAALDRQALVQLGEDVANAGSVVDAALGPVVRPLVVQRAAKLAQEHYWRAAVHAAESFGLEMEPAPNQVEALLLRRL